VTDFDILIVVLFDMFDGDVRYQVIPTVDLQDKEGVNDLIMGWLSTTDLPIVDELNLILTQDKQVREFPYDAFKSASNPKVLSIILD